MNENPAVETEAVFPEEAAITHDSRLIGVRRLWAFAASLLLLCVGFSPAIREWVTLALAEDLHSHVILIPVISAYLLMTGRDELAWDSRPSPRLGGALVLLASATIAWWLVARPAWSALDGAALKMGAWLIALWGIGFLFLGVRWMRSALFPMAFLLFMIPLPDMAVWHLEEFLMVASAMLSESVFSWGGIPVFRTGQVLEIPGIVLVVAQECSGIRSTWVLFITSVVAAHLFLPTTARRLVLLGAVVPLGILRNAVRIYVIGWLCVEYGPEMIHHWIHRKGGPLFFGASLVPLFLLAWALRGKRKNQGEVRGRRG
jgi:exosortase C (VPDSG-CTERM-specific)